MLINKSDDNFRKVIIKFPRRDYKKLEGIFNGKLSREKTDYFMDMTVFAVAFPKYNQVVFDEESIFVVIRYEPNLPIYNHGAGFYAIGTARKELGRYYPIYGYVN